MVDPDPTTLTLPTRHFALLLLLVPPAMGCAGGTETGNPPLTAQLSYAAYSSDPVALGVRAPAAIASVAAVWLVLDDVSFAPGQGCDGRDAGGFTAPGIGVGDHATGAPVTTRFELEEGQYCAVRVPLTLAGELPDDAPVELAGSSILVSGELAGGTPFSIRSVSSLPFLLLPDAASFSLDAGSPDSLVAFDVAEWLRGLDFEGASLSGGVIEISPEENQPLLRTFEDNLATGVTLYRDREGDGRLDQNPERLAR